MAHDLFARANGVGIEVDLQQSAKDFLVEKGYDPKFGARPLRRAIQKYIEDPMAEAILGNNLSSGDIIKITHDGKDETQELKIETAKSAPKKTKAKKTTATKKEAAKDDGKDAPASDAKPSAKKAAEESKE